MTKELTIEAITLIAETGNNGAIAKHLAKQLLAAIQREAKLREAMLETHRLITEGEIFEATAILKICGDNSNKELDPKGAMISRMWDGTIDDPTKT